MLNGLIEIYIVSFPFFSIVASFGPLDSDLDREKEKKIKAIVLGIPYPNIVDCEKVHLGREEKGKEKVKAILLRMHLLGLIVG